MQTISWYLVKISVNVVNYCTIITWYKIVIDNCFCDGQSSKRNNSKSINDIVTILASHFMQTISSYLVKISVNVVNYCSIITWYKIVIDNCFCDEQSSKRNNSKSINDIVTILALCTSTHVG